MAAAQVSRFRWTDPPSITQPLVSIALPTKNRAFLLRDRIRFALDQSYSNIEVVVADNDDTHATREVV